MNIPIASTPLPGTVWDPSYPDSDGKPMGETGFHVLAIIYLYEALREHFHDRPDVYVAADMFFYYEQGNPRANKSPDVMFIPGVGNHERRSFRLWEEARGPSVIFEMVSENTWKEDLNDKPVVYARLGVAEYFVFDPEARWITPVLQGFHLVQGQYTPLRAASDGSMISQELGLRIVPEGRLPRLVDAATNQPLPTSDERQQLAEQEKQRAEQEKQRAEQEKQRADALAAEVARLQALLKERGQDQ